MKKVLIVGAESYIGMSFQNYIGDDPKYRVDTLDVRGLIPRVEMLKGYDVVFFVAGIAHRKETKEIIPLYYKVNRDLAVVTAQRAKEAGVGQFILMSSMAVYGVLEGHINHDTIPTPNTHYGKSKYEADMIIQDLADEGFKVAILRPPMVYGKNCKGNYQLLRRIALTSPVFPKVRNQRSMIYIENLCDFVKQTIVQGKNGVFFPQNEEYVNTTEMVCGIAQAHGRKIRLIGGMNPIIAVCSWLKPVKKAFGSLTYETSDLVTFCSLKDSIVKSES